MIPVKVECVCGQKYAFDVEPVNGRMGTRVQCPVCGAEGTAAANAIIAQTLGVAPSAPTIIRLDEPATAPAYRVAPAPATAPAFATAAAAPPAPPPQLRINAHAPAAAAPPPLPTGRPTAIPGRPMMPPPKPKRGNDGWASDETGTHKLGTYIITIPGILGSTIMAGFLGLVIPTEIMVAVIALCGVLGGIVNIWGRGPVWAGVIVGMIMALGGFTVAFFYISWRGDGVWIIEATLAFVAGCIPGMLLQKLLQKMWWKSKGG